MTNLHKLWFTILLIVTASASEAKEPKQYSMALDGQSQQNEAIVKLQRKKGGAALLLLTFDGTDPRSLPSMSDYAELVRQGEARTKPGQKPGLINASPGRNEPQLLGVSPGVHKYGVLFFLTDISRKLATTEIASVLTNKYLPKNDVLLTGNEILLVTVKHYEELTFTAVAGKKYYIQYLWDKETADLRFNLVECKVDWKECSDTTFSTDKAQTKVLPVVSDQEL